MNQLHEIIYESVGDAQVKAQKISDYYTNNETQISIVANELTGIKVIRAIVSADDDIEIHMAGDELILKSIFKAFRKLGYKPNDRPDDKPLVSFNTFFTHTEHKCKFYLIFSATNCTKVKVRTEMQEVDIYETVCE